MNTKKDKDKDKDKDVDRCAQCGLPSATLYCDICTTPETVARYSKIKDMNNHNYVASLRVKALTRRLGFDPREE